MTGDDTRFAFRSLRDMNDLQDKIRTHNSVDGIQLGRNPPNRKVSSQLMAPRTFDIVFSSQDVVVRLCRLPLETGDGATVGTYSGDSPSLKRDDACIMNRLGLSRTHK